MMAQDLERLSAQKLNILAGHFAQLRQLLTFPDDYQTFSGTYESAHGKISPLVTDQLTYHEIKIVKMFRNEKIIHRHWRIHNISLTAIMLCDPPRDIGRICHEMVHPIRAEPVPQTQVMKKGSHEKSFNNARI